MILPLNSQQALPPSSHARETIPNEIGFWILIRVAQDMCNGDGVGGHEPAPPNESAIDKGAPIRGLPGRDEVGVFLVVHLAQVAHEEGRGWRAGEVAER